MHVSGALKQGKGGWIKSSDSEEPEEPIRVPRQLQSTVQANHEQALCLEPVRI
jgi:hypothetical protein